MIRIPCPYCGPRNSTEFRHVGEPARRPVGPDVPEAEWRSYLYGRENLLGWVVETWYHGSGCRRFLTVERHTESNEISRATPVEVER
jgi:sarcosine oxidase, subunit delta